MMRVGFPRPAPAIVLSALLLAACASPAPSWLASGAAPGSAASAVAQTAGSSAPGAAVTSPAIPTPLAAGSPTLAPSRSPSPEPTDRWVRAAAIEQPSALTEVPLDSAGNPLGACGTCHPPIATVLVDAADGPEGLVAVGYELPDFTGAAWWSADGSRWSLDAPAFPGISMLSSVTADSNGYVAVGRAGDRSAAWRSADGRTWTRAPDTGGIATPHLRLASVDRWKGGFVAVGYVGAEFGDADVAFLVSPDGRSWTLAPTTDATRSARAVAVAATGPALVAVGSTGPGSRGPAAIWTSVDGLHWARVADSPALADLRLRAVAADFGADGSLGGVVAVGENASGSVGAVLRSADGRTWERLPADPALGRPGIQVRMYDVTATGRGLVAAGVVTEGIQYGVAAIWTLHDGTWTLEPASEMLSDGEINALVPLGSRLFGVGDRGAPDAYVATVWHSPDGWAP
jgi:hypothetical protein